MNFFHTIENTIELSLGSIFSHISSKSSSGEIQRIDNNHTARSGNSSCHDISDEEFKWVFFGFIGVENSLNFIFDGKVKGSSGEISDNIGGVSSPECETSFFSNGSLETIKHVLIRSVFESRVGVSGLH